MPRTLSDAQRRAVFEKKSGVAPKGVSMPKLAPTAIKAPKAPQMGQTGTNPMRFGNSGIAPPTQPPKFGMAQPSMSTASGVPGVPKLSTANRKSVSRFGA